MKKLILSLFCLFPFTAYAAGGASITATMNMRVVNAISVASGVALEFGSFSAPSSGSGLLTVAQSGTIATGGVVTISSGASRSPGTFSVSGEASTLYTFNLPSSVTLTGSSGGTMTAALSFSSGSSSRTLDTAGSETVTINGTLTVPANQTAGTYIGSYSVTVAY